MCVPWCIERQQVQGWNVAAPGTTEGFGGGFLHFSKFYLKDIDREGV